MNSALLAVLSMSASGALLTLALCVLRPLWRERFGRTWQYYIWLVVVLRLLLPFSPPVSAAGALQSAPTARAELSAFGTGARADAPEAETGVEGAADASGYSGADGAGAVSFVPRPASPANGGRLRALARDWAWAVWLCGALVAAARQITAYALFCRFVRAGGAPVEDPVTLSAYRRAADAAGIRRRPELRVHPMAASPMLVGAVRPVLILPRLELGADQLACVFRHELIHLRRRDVWFKWAAQLAVCVHWFNPFAYLARREIGRACELACDEAALAGADGGAKRLYGDTLLAAVRGGPGFGVRAGAASLTLGEEGGRIRERLDAIVGGRRRSKGTAAAAAAAAALIALGAAFTGVYAAAPSGRDEALTAGQVDEMTLALVRMPYTWELVQFFLPYMSPEGRAQIPRVSDEAEWSHLAVAGEDGKPIRGYTARQVAEALASAPKNEDGTLTRGELDDFATGLMWLGCEWDVLLPFAPHMTDGGLRAAARLCGLGEMPLERLRGQPGEPGAIPQERCDALALVAVQKSRNWEYACTFWDYLSDAGKRAVLEKTKRMGTPIFAYEFENGAQAYEDDGDGALSPQELGEALTEIMDNTGTWNDALDEFLPLVPLESAAEIHGIYDARHGGGAGYRGVDPAGKPLADLTQAQADALARLGALGGYLNEQILRAVPYMSPEGVDRLASAAIDEVGAGRWGGADPGRIAQLEGLVLYMSEEGARTARERIARFKAETAG